jgi:hypothetical protein
MKKTIAILLLVTSLVFLVMGLTYPFMTFKIDIKMDTGGGGIIGSFFGNSIAEKFNKTVTYNIPQIMEMLFKFKKLG